MRGKSFPFVLVECFPLVVFAVYVFFGLMLQAVVIHLNGHYRLVASTRGNLSFSCSGWTQKKRLPRRLLFAKETVREEAMLLFCPGWLIELLHAKMIITQKQKRR